MGLFSKKPKCGTSGCQEGRVKFGMNPDSPMAETWCLYCGATMWVGIETGRWFKVGEPGDHAVWLKARRSGAEGRSD